MEQFKNYLGISIGSLNELNTQLEVAYRVGYLSEVEHNRVQATVDECLAVTFGLKRSLKERNNS